MRLYWQRLGGLWKLRRKRKRRWENNVKMDHRELDCEIKTESYWLSTLFIFATFSYKIVWWFSVQISALKNGIGVFFPVYCSECHTSHEMSVQSERINFRNWKKKLFLWLGCSYMLEVEAAYSWCALGTVQTHCTFGFLLDILRFWTIHKMYMIGEWCSWSPKTDLGHQL
jgi:hypothetical protein